MPVLAFLLLSACAALDEDGNTAGASICPEGGFLGAARDAVFYDGKGKAPENIVTRAVLSDFRGGCKYVDGKTVATVDVILAAETGAAGQGLAEQEYEWFSAVLSPDNRILQKRVFSTLVKFDDKGRALSRETIRHTLFVSDAEDGRKYRIVLGLQLKPEPAPEPEKPVSKGKKKKK